MQFHSQFVSIMNVKKITAELQIVFKIVIQLSTKMMCFIISFKVEFDKFDWVKV